MTIQDIHAFIDFVTDKEQLGMIIPADKDRALDRASMETFRSMLPYYAVNQTFQDALAPFKTPHVFTNTTSTNGIVQLPDNYVHLLSVTAMVFDNEKEQNKQLPVEFVNADELAERSNSQLKPVTSNKPLAHWIGKGRFQLYPTRPAVGQVCYLKRPSVPKFAYSTTNRTVTYLPDSSVQMEWGEIEITTVMYRALQLLGVNLSDEQLIQYTQLKIAEA